MRESKTTLLMASVNLNVQSSEFNDKCPHPEARPSLHLAGNRELNGDGVEHDTQLCRPIPGSSEVSCVDNQNLNATQMHQELVTIHISDSLLQPMILGEAILP